jgi:Rho GTPase-activating protein 39
MDGFARVHFAKGVYKVGKGLRVSTKVSSVPMLQAVKDASLSKEACNMFKSLMMIVGEKSTSKQQSVGELARHVLMLGNAMSVMRDELYVQLVRHTCNNQNAESVERAWQMLVVAASCYPPSAELDPFLEEYFAQRILADIKVPAAALAAAAQRQLRRSHARAQAADIGSAADVDVALAAANSPYMFGGTVEQIMRDQRADFPELPLPAIVPACLDAIRALGGLSTEGIFRIPGDGDVVSYLRLQVECGQLSEFPTADPRDMCSLLSSWLRQLAEPIVPNDLYDACLELATKEPKDTVAILDRLPAPNRAVIETVVRFLQELAQHEKVTKMNLDNLALVFAPNFVRCPSANPAIMLQNAKNEVQFVSNLVQHLK